MTLQVVTSGAFTAPGLPSLDPQGFVDTFSRPNSDLLGSTEEPSRPWTITSPGAVASGIRGGTAFIRRADVVGAVHAVADSRASDVDMSITLASIAPGWQREFGPIVRYSSDSNMWRFVARDGVSFRIVKYANSSYTAVWTSEGITPAVGDILRVVAVGDSLTFYVNDTQVHQITDSFNQNATRHGWYGNTTEDTDRVDNITVTPLFCV